MALMVLMALVGAVDIFVQSMPSNGVPEGIVLIPAETFMMGSPESEAELGRSKR